MFFGGSILVVLPREWTSYWRINFPTQTQTWISPDTRTRNQIDHIAISQQWRRSLQDVKAIRGADVNSDHHLLLGILKLKLKKMYKKERSVLFDSQKLRDPGVKTRFTLELRNRFQLLEDIPAEDIDSICNITQSVFEESSKEVLGHKRRERKEWISEDTWTLINQRKETKQKILASKEEEQKKTLQEDYSKQNLDVKKNARKDKRIFTDNLAQEAQNAADSGDTRTVYRVTKILTRSFYNQATVVKDKDGNVLMKEEDQLNRWAEHFKEILNRPNPEEEAEIEDMGFQMEMRRGRITDQEIIEAIKSTKANRAPGEDRITSDMLKAEPETSARILSELFNQVWEEERVPEAWKKGVIVKLPKKGDLSICGNWRGINLLSVPGKIFCRIILQRLKQSIERTLREEQAGFRSGRSCADQIFVLTHFSLHQLH